jgi:prepilin-type N-terminal cleavage/methylation domain-containing protein
VKSTGPKKQTGFSLTELLIVVAIILIVGGVALPSFSRMLDTARLKSASQQVASLYHQARIRAAQDNTYYEIVGTGAGVRPALLCIDLDNDGLCGANEPQVQLPGGVSLNNTAIPVVLDQSTLGFSPVSIEGSVMYNQQDNLVPGLAWNERGLPCQRTTTASPCVNLIPSGSVAWVQYLQMQQSAADVAYAAVTVSPTGRIKTWTYSGPGGRSWF